MTKQFLTYKTWLAVSLAGLAGCAGPQVRGPVVQLCEIQAVRGGIECGLTNKKQVFFKWDELKEKFLTAFNGQVILTQDGFKALVGMGHKK